MDSLIILGLLLPVILLSVIAAMPLTLILFAFIKSVSSIRGEKSGHIMTLLCCAVLVIFPLIDWIWLQLAETGGLLGMSSTGDLMTWVTWGACVFSAIFSIFASAESRRSKGRLWQGTKKAHV